MNVMTKIDRSMSWSGVDFVSTQEYIGDGVEWAIRDERHAIILHLGGTMRELETELDGQGMSFQPAMAGEVWTVPAGSQYAARARGQTIAYAVLYLSTTAMSP